MADEILISDIVDLGGIEKDINTLLGQINKVDLAIQEVNKNPINLGNVGGLKELKQATEQLLKATQNLNKAITDTTKVTKAAADADLKASKAKTEESKQATEAAKTKALEAKAAIDVAKAKQIENKEREASTKFTAAEKKQIDLISNDYKLLSKAYEEAALKSKNYYLTLGANHPITIQAQKDAKDLKTILDTVDQATGDYRRNVGNYGSALSNLRLQTGQLLREMPALAINAQTFILALSNNLPLFFEAIENVKKANVELAASGQKPVPVFQQIIRSLFSLQSILTIGVTLLTVFSGKIVDWVSELFKGDDGTKKINRQLNEFNQIVEASSKQIERLTDNLQFLQKLSRININISTTNTPQLDKLKGDLTFLRETSIDQLEITDNLEKKEKQLNETRSKAYDLFLNTLTNADRKLLDANGGFAAAEFMSGELSDNAKRTYDGYVKVNEALTQTQNALSQSRDTQRIIYRQIAQEKTDIEKEQAAQTRKLILETITIEADTRKRAAESVLNNDKSNLDERLAALRSYLNAEKAIIEAQKNDVLANPESSPEERRIAVLKANEAAYSANKDYEEKSFRQKEDFRLRDIEAERKIFTEKKQLQADLLRSLSDNAEFNLNDRLGLSQSAFEAEKAIINKEYEAQKESVKNKFLTDAEKLAIETEYETKLLELNRKAQKEITEIIKTSIERRQELSKEEVEQIERVYNDINLNASEQYSQDVIDLNNSLRTKIISYDKYLKQRKELDNKYRLESIQNNVNKLDDELNNPVFSQAKAQLEASEVAVNFFENRLRKARTDNEKESAANSLSIARKDYEVAKENYDKKVTLETQLAELKRQLNEEGLRINEEDFRRRMDTLSFWLDQASQLAQAIGSIGSAIHQRRLDEINEEQNALEERYQKEQDLIRQAYTNQVDQQQKLAEAEKRYNAQKHQLQEQEKQERIKQARFEKEASIASIILNTAAAVVKALPSIPLSIAAGVIGAAQLAVAIATPLPRFFKGKNADDNYEGFAWVDDGGRPEAIIRENGEVEIGTNKPRITYLGAKDIVLPDARQLAWNSTISAANKAIHVTTNSDDQLRRELNRGFKSVVGAIKNQPRQKQLNTKDALMKAWLSSERPFKDFFS